MITKIERIKDRGDPPLRAFAFNYLDLLTNRGLARSSQGLSNDNFDSYISGFVDGEGSFSISFRHSKKHRLGIEARPSFNICQKKTPEDRAFLKKIQLRFNGGAILKAFRLFLQKSSDSFG